MFLSLEEEIADYIKTYKQLSWFFKKYFTKEEVVTLDKIMYDYLPQQRRALGEKLIFCHADMWEYNILIDENGKVGIIDCGHAGYFDEAMDFCLLDEQLRELVLDYYGADETLRKKTKLKYYMNKLKTPKVYASVYSEDFANKNLSPDIRKIIAEYTLTVADS